MYTTTALVALLAASLAAANPVPQDDCTTTTPECLPTTTVTIDPDCVPPPNGYPTCAGPACPYPEPTITSYPACPCYDATTVTAYGTCPGTTCATTCPTVTSTVEPSCTYAK